MSKRDKLRQKLKNNPRGVQFSAIETLLTRFDFKLVRISGSHHIFRYESEDEKVTIVVPTHANRVKVPYVKEVIALLDQLFPEDDDDEEDVNEQDD